jgi:hypothetical protein
VAVSEIAEKQKSGDRIQKPEDKKNKNGFSLIF